MKKNNKYVKKRHKFYFSVARPIAWILAKKYHYTTKPKKMKKGEQYLILANHQGFLDPVFLALSFKAPVYMMATDSMFTTKWYSRLMMHCFAPIKKRKGIADISCIRTAMQIAKEGGNVALFPEANRAWCDFQFYIDKSICKLVRMLNLPVILFNFQGGYGVNPRWSSNIRKGSHKGVIREILTLEQIDSMTNDQLYNYIVEKLKVIDSDSGQLYKSDKKAEYLERQLFVCPECHSVSTLVSSGNTIHCTHCNLQVNYGENLLLTSENKNFHFKKVVDWYKFQQEFVKNYQVEPNKVIVQDENVELYDKTTENRILCATGKMSLDSQKIQIDNFSIDLKDITSATAINGTRMILNTEEKSYYVIGNERFNGIKYLLFFNILCPQISKHGGDKYYGLSTDTSI